MNEQYIRQIVREELNNQTKSGQLDISGATQSALNRGMFQDGKPLILRHLHDDVSSPKLNQVNIHPGIRTSGSVTFTTTGKKTLYINNPNPTLILCYGTVTGVNGVNAVRVHTFGSAQIGQSFYLQPDTINTVKIGGPQQPFIQSSSYISVEDATFAFHALTDEEHLVDVEFPVGTIHARLTLTGYTSNSIILNVDNLDSGWSIIVNLVVI